MAWRASLVLELVLLATAWAHVVVYNCCPNGTVLSEDRSCIPFSFHTWAPAILSRTQGGLLEPGTLPEDWIIEEDTIPVCKPSEYLLFVASDIDEYNSPSFLLLDNGSLVLMPPHPDVPGYVNPPQYCVNLGGCFVCVPLPGDGDRPLPVRKCCGPSAVFSEKSKSCKLHSQNLHVPDVTLIEGFPDCSLGFTISGKLDDETHRLLPNGSLRISDKEVEEFCIDHVIEHPTDGVHIFTCSLPSGASPSKSDIRFTLYPLGLFLSVFFLAV